MPENWTAQLNRKFSTGGMAPAAGNPGMGAGGVPYASGLMGKPSVQAARPGGNGSPAGMGPPPSGSPASPGGSSSNGIATPAQPASAGSMGQPPPTPEVDAAMQMTQQLIEKFRMMAQRRREMGQMNRGY